MAGKLQDYPEISLNPYDLNGTIDFADIFGRSRPVHIEIGTGKGTFLLNEAKALPEVNFLGIEWSSKYYRYAVDRAGRWGLENVRIIRTDAANFIRNFLGDGSVTCFHIYFPDPWPKRRHRKRRFFSRENIQQLIRCISACGTVKVATDYAEYFEAINELMKEFKLYLTSTEFVHAFGAQENELTGTNFERKYRRQRKQIYTAAWQKL